MANAVCLPPITTKPSLNTSKKKKKKKQLCIGVVTSLTKANKSDFFFAAMTAICELDIRLMVLAEGDEEAQKKCFELLEHYPDNFTILEATPQSKDRIIESCDIMLFAHKPTKTILKKIVNQGIVPILPEGAGIDNFDPQRESGAGFTFTEGNFWQMVTAIIRASENYRFPYDWRSVKKNLSKVVV